MPPLTKEQRAAKFATAGKDAPGLRSRGHRKLGVSEQRALFDELERYAPQHRLDTLRILREAVRSVDSPNPELEKAVYERSAKEAVDAQEFTSVVHVLGHLCSLSNVSTYWQKLYVIALANVKQFENAARHCYDNSDKEYVRSVLNMDVPLWSLLVHAESDTTCRKLMNQISAEVDAYKSRLNAAYKHPSLARSSNTAGQKQVG